MLALAGVCSTSHAQILVWSRIDPKVLNETQFLNCIEEVESGLSSTWKPSSSGKWKIGELGERGPWQIAPGTWAEHSSYDFSKATRYQHYVTALNIIRHYNQLLKTFNKPTTPYTMALCWCSGPYRKAPSKRAIDYAQRVQNIYDEKSKHP